MKTIIDAYKFGEEFHSQPIPSAGTKLPDSIDTLYRDIPTGRIYSWDGQHYRDRSFHQDYTYYNMGQGDRIDTNKIYFAKPGQRILGVLNGVEEDSCSLTDNLNNTSELTFTVDRIINTDEGVAEVSQFYDLISRHYELYLPHHGWFKINEEPEIDNDGNIETKSVRAESLEIELQQYDLVNFRINTASEDSKEMLATDNTYDFEGYTVFQDNVRFYRNPAPYEKFIASFKETGQTLADLDYAVKHDFTMLTSPRIQFSVENIDVAIQSAIDEYQEAGNEEAVAALTEALGKITEDNPREAKKLAFDLPILIKYLDITVDQTDPDDEENELTLVEVLEREVQRQNELSLMYLVLHEHGWNVGFVDPTVIPDSDIEDDTIALADKTGYFDIDSQDIYSFLTQNAAQTYRCIFVFDTENYLVNCYNINNIGYDTNIFLSFHNIQNEVSRSSDRELYTVFHVQGAEELDFTEANLGEDWISDISYFLNTDHFSPEFIEKYETYLETREANRLDYIQASKDYREKDAIAQEIYDRVPIDNADGAQYSTMDEDELLVERANREAEKRGYESQFEDPSTHEIDWEALEDSLYWKRYKILTETVLSSPLDALDYVQFIQGEESDEYEYGFDENHSDYRLGNIDIALFNLRVIDGYYVDPEMSDTEKMKRINVKNQKKYLDNYQYDFERYGDAYGLAELRNQIKVLKNAISTLESTGKNESDGTTFDEETYTKYEKYTTALAQCEVVLAERQAEYDAALAEIDDVVSRQNQLKADSNITNPTFGFTEEELILLDKYYIHTDYVNENILTTSQSTNDQIVDTENQLYLDAMEQLYVESHPQYTWSTTQDNLLLMPEFQDWHGDLHVGNFLRVSMRDDYQVKLRISSITLNPLMLEPTIDINFTTMTQYRSKRNDYTDLMAQANASSKNQITSTFSRNSGDNTVNVDTDLVLKLLNNSTFSSYMGNQIANVSGNAINAVSGSIDNLVAQSINTVDINVDRIVGTTGQFEALWSNYISSNYIVSRVINAENASIQNLTAKIITVGGTQITEDLIQTANISADQITSGTINADLIDSDTVIAKLVDADVGDFDELTAQSGFIQYLNSGIIEAGTVNADTIIAGLAEVTPQQISKFDLLAGSAFISYLNSEIIDAGTVNAETVIAALVDAQVGDFDELTAQHAFVQYLQSVSNTAITQKANEGYFYNLVAGNISVADLATHTASANEIILISNNGEPAIAFSNATQQFYDEDGNVRVQIGQDGNGDFNFIVRGADGTTALFNENGITQNGVPSNTIINNMIVDSTIQKSKIGFPIVETNQDGTINITSIKDGSGGNFGVSYTTFTQNTTDALEEINSKKMYRVEIMSSNGNYFKNGNLSTVLSCHVYSWDDDITDDLNASAFKWTKINNDGTPDSTWNTVHFGGAKSVTITSADVYIRGTFICTVTLPDGSVVSSGD